MIELLILAAGMMTALGLLYRNGLGFNRYHGMEWQPTSIFGRIRLGWLRFVIGKTPVIMNMTISRDDSADKLTVDGNCVIIDKVATTPGLRISNYTY